MRTCSEYVHIPFRISKSFISKVAKSSLSSEANGVAREFSSPVMKAAELCTRNVVVLDARGERVEKEVGRARSESYKT